ncbi:endo-beta-N-acetylglucosaminidase [Streptomyces natalensis]|uniref:Endo-beta-N-acetylglucosaminidase n=1 Tax=Streptomyces natalensis ATCC 27448 TaxID=1240678 RepID=A0A0D7CL50_9ACTN|nr:endo-beta-N-acetylglucosaminidase [Streptomyces natalensis]KIZ16944.1 endo-beta-N-acetylglucosaminidase [Streptomyces natalensis ATCC 27448]
MSPHPRPPSRRRVLLAGAGAAAALLGPAPAAGATGRRGAADSLQPYASYWFPDSLPPGAPGDGITWRSLADWTPEGDRDLAFNAASVPLAERFTPVPANTTARAGQARISALAAFDHTAGNPSQGSATADFYAPTHWAYLDELVFWGGSSGEGLILAPNAPVTDAAHRNGVPVLGTVFLPPSAFGGDLRWTRDLVQRDAAGGFPLAAQLVRVAAAYGFDGWFVNAETDGGDAALADRMRGFLKALRAAGGARGLRITWYDALNTTGEVGWQGALDALNRPFFQDATGPVADGLFLDFRWSARSLADSGRLAERLGRSRYDLWAGVDVESAGWDSPVDWDAIVPADGAQVVSYGFYRPEWTLHHLPQGRTPGDFHAADDRFWCGERLDPARPGGGSGWRAPAAAVADRSTLTALPFATTFNTGHGLRWYEEGVATSPAPWNHLGLQDRLPPRRWSVRTAGRRPRLSLDFADAWRGGSSLLVRGGLDAPATVELFPARLPADGDTVVEMTHRVDAASGPVAVEVAVALREPSAPGAPAPYAFLPAGTVEAGGGWRTVSVPLAALGPGVLHSLGVRLSGRGTGAVAWRLGALAVRSAAVRPAAPAGLRVTGAATADGTVSLRLGWRRAPGPIRHYALHRTLPDGSRRFLGGTCGAAFHVPGLRREGNEQAVRLAVCAISELFTASDPAETTHPW